MLYVQFLERYLFILAPRWKPMEPLEAESLEPETPETPQDGIPMAKPVNDEHKLIAIGVAVLLLASAFIIIYKESKEDQEGLVPVWERHKQDYIVGGPQSYVLEQGPYKILETDHPHNATHVWVEVDLPITEGGAAIDPNDVPRMSLAYFRPDVPEGMKVPTIMEIGPYFLEVTDDVDVPGYWLGTSIMSELLPHGYAFAQASVFGTGSSNHCMDLMGTAEQLGIDAVVTYLANEPWSNGNVAMIGKSYDGSTPWQAAMFGNPALKTIVPISGLIGVKELMWRNGSSETRASIMHNGVYGPYGIHGTSDDMVIASCPDYATGWAHGGAAVLIGDELVDLYWAERYFLQRVLDNYEGSVYIIQGMQDWNVDPHMAVPVINQLQDAGIEAKAWLGQWEHDYPDKWAAHENRTSPGRGAEAFPKTVRWDWMQDLLEWFNFYLKDGHPRPGHYIEVQDNLGNWRIEDRYPLDHPEYLELSLGGELEHVSGGTVLAGSNYVPGTSTEIVFETDPFEEELRFGYLPQFHVTVTLTGNGGQIYALLEDSVDNIHLGHAIMDLRYYEGGDEQQFVMTGQTITARMEFWAMDVIVPEGHGLRLTLLPTGEDYVNTATNFPVAIHINEDSVLKLPLVHKEEKRYFTPPVWDGPG